MKQIFEWARFVKSKIKTIRFSYLRKALLITSTISSKNVAISPFDVGLYILKQSHFFFEIVISEQTHLPQ